MVGLSPEVVGMVLSGSGVRVELQDTQLVWENWLVFNKITFLVSKMMADKYSTDYNL